ncbi:hypothetical protein EVA_14590 [gut metagenome]|uniref:Uncharacterized protein n=1 Tax=gut metagenome TaxID=749906 RepID=J9GD42_9ZZZZ
MAGSIASGKVSLVAIAGIERKVWHLVETRHEPCRRGDVSD